MKRIAIAAPVLLAACIPQGVEPPPQPAAPIPVPVIERRPSGDRRIYPAPSPSRQQVTPGRPVVSGKRYHVVKAGESGIAIARSYGVDWDAIIAANALPPPYTLRAGQSILIPDASARPNTARERAAAFRLDIDDLVTGSEPAVARGRAPAPPRRQPAPSPPVGTSAFAWPVRGTILRRFGADAGGGRSDGIDIAVPRGTPVLAAADGTVAYAGTDIPAFGALVIVKHGRDVVTVYGYADRLMAARGQSVQRGATIALSGASGAAKRPALHFEIRQGRTPVDPLARLPAR